MKSSVPLRALSRTNLADTSRHSSPNSRPVSLLQPLVPLQKSQLLCHSSKSSLSLAQSAFCEESQTPGVGHISTSASRFVSAVTCITWRLYPLWPQSIAHTSRHHGGVPPKRTLYPLWPSKFARPLFSYSYKSLFPQPLSFHIHTKPRGCHPPADRRDTHTLAKSFRIRSYENTRDGVRNAFRAAVRFWRHMHPVARRATPECFPLPRAVNLVPAARRQQRADARADQGECRSQYGFAVGSRADNRVWRAIVINRNASTESPTRSNRCPDQRMLAPVTGRFEGNAPYRIARDASVFTGDSKHQHILRGRLKFALRRRTLLDRDLDGLAHGNLFQAAPIGFLHRPHQWVGCQREQRTEQCDVPDSFRGFHRKSPYIRAYVACWMAPSDKERRVS